MPRTLAWSLTATALVAAAACAPAPRDLAEAAPARTPTPSVTPTVPSARAAASLPAAPAPTASAPTASARPSRPARSARLRVVVLDPGHDGGNAAHPAEINRQVPAGNGRTKPCNTVGAVTPAGYPEHAFAWDVTLRTRALLAARGVRVVLTRSSDTGVGPCVDERGRAGERARADAVVSVHADGAAPGGSGFHVITAPGDDPAAVSSRRLAVAVHSALRSGSGLRVASYVAAGDGFDVRTDLAGLTLSTRPTLVVEAGNMRNAGDAALQQSAAGRQRIAAALAAGILAYLR